MHLDIFRALLYQQLISCMGSAGVGPTCNRSLFCMIIFIACAIEISLTIEFTRYIVNFYRQSNFATAIYFPYVNIAPDTFISDSLC